MVERDERVFFQLRKLGLRLTSTRICVLQVLQDHHGKALAVDEIFLKLHAMGVSIGLGTIYRVLGELAQRKLVHREWDAQGVVAKSRYILAPHGHAPQIYALVCPSCGLNHDIDDKPFVEAMQRQALAGGFEQGLAAVSISIRCNRCVSDGLASAAGPESCRSPGPGHGQP